MDEKVLIKEADLQIVADLQREVCEYKEFYRMLKAALLTEEVPNVLKWEREDFNDPFNILLGIFKRLKSKEENICTTD